MSMQFDYENISNLVSCAVVHNIDLKIWNIDSNITVVMHISQE